MRLTPNKYPNTSKRVPAPPARGELAPLPPPSTLPPDLDTSTRDRFFPTSRVPEGSTDNSDHESDADRTYQIPTFQKSNSWREESKWASNDPDRVKTASELLPSHTWDTVETLSKQALTDLKQFQDEMYEALAKVHTTTNGSRLRIRVPEDIVINISSCFARARMLNLDLARRTESFFVDWPNRLLTVAVPTDFEVKKAWGKQGNSKYAFYHKTDWSTVPKILSEGMIRPADWTKDSTGVPQQFPSYGPFGMAVEAGSVYAPLQPYAANQLSNGLFRIGKGHECGDHRVLSMSSDDEASGRWQ